ncbi:MAG: TIGR04283 family arsenosugar biosynthesis glycosyltransferase [Rhodoblastus sp.]
MIRRGVKARSGKAGSAFGPGAATSLRTGGRGARVSIIVPVLNEAGDVLGRLAALAPLRAQDAEVIVVDGGSVDETQERATPFCDRLVVAPRGRAAQMNAGAALASGDILLFLHLDTALPSDALRFVRAGLAAGPVWGRFDVRILGAHPLLPVVAALMNLRSRATGIATGDQAMFVTRAAFRHIGGFPAIALMEDIALSKALKRLSAPLCLAARVSTSGRRWDRNGFWRTVYLMWRLRLAYFCGADPAALARIYGYAHDI